MLKVVDINTGKRRRQARDAFYKVVKSQEILAFVLTLFFSFLFHVICSFQHWHDRQKCERAWKRSEPGMLRDHSNEVSFLDRFNLDHRKIRAAKLCSKKTPIRFIFPFFALLLHYMPHIPLRRFLPLILCRILMFDWLSNLQPWERWGRSKSYAPKFLKIQFKNVSSLVQHLKVRNQKIKLTVFSLRPQSRVRDFLGCRCKRRRVFHKEQFLLPEKSMSS